MFRECELGRYRTGSLAIQILLAIAAKCIL
jgi:hypothetical protein